MCLGDGMNIAQFHPVDSRWLGTPLMTTAMQEIEDSAPSTSRIVQIVNEVGVNEVGVNEVGVSQTDPCVVNLGFRANPHSSLLNIKYLSI